MRTPTIKVRPFPKIFDDDQLHGIRWQLDAAINEIKHCKDPEMSFMVLILLK
jgi:hypothetical protein